MKAQTSQSEAPYTGDQSVYETKMTANECNGKLTNAIFIHIKGRMFWKPEILR